MSEKNAKINRRMINKYHNKIYKNVHKRIIIEIENYNLLKRLKYLLTGKLI